MPVPLSASSLQSKRIASARWETWWSGRFQFVPLRVRADRAGFAGFSHGLSIAENSRALTMAVDTVRT